MPWRPQIDIPAGYSVRWGGQFELQERSRRTFLIVTPLTLVLVSLLLYAIFGSAVEAGVILINIPLALTGGLAALLISGQYMSVPASIGFIAIFGIALEDGLVLLSTIRSRFQGRGSGLGSRAVWGHGQAPAGSDDDLYHHLWDSPPPVGHGTGGRDPTSTGDGGAGRAPHQHAW